MSRLPYVVYSTSDGSVGEQPQLRAIDFAGRPLDRTELTPLPEGATLAMLPRRLAVGLDSSGERKVVRQRHGWALAALLPIGYTRTALPGYKLTSQSEHLPFFGYAAVAGIQGELFVSAMRTDDPGRWLPRRFARERLERLVAERMAQEPDNRVIAHHAHCALDYSCPTASNIFLRRWEGAVAVSPGCNARCIGCISKQDEDEPVSPQDRLTFVPSVEEVIEVGVAHLERADDAIFSFGQGCEGEPLIQGRLIEAAIRGIRARTTCGTLNINTNASNPRALQRLYDAGLDSVRASTISARAETYNAYYRPVGYRFEAVAESLRRAHDAGVYGSINLLVFPGLIDAPDEVAALVAFLRETHVKLVQLRNLNIDPEVLLPKMPPLVAQPMGIRRMIDTVRREIPDIVIGNFSRTAQRAQPSQPSQPSEGRSRAGGQS